MEDTIGVRLHLQPATGSGAALCRWLRTSSRRYHRPIGQIHRAERTHDWIKRGGKVSVHHPLHRGVPAVIHLESSASGDRRGRADRAPYGKLAMTTREGDMARDWAFGAVRLGRQSNLP